MSSDFAASIATSAGELEIRGSAATDVGLVRAVNEDAYYAGTPVYLVADGMGGHSYGDLASSTVAEVFGEVFGAHQQPTTPEAVIEAVDAANTRIQELMANGSEPDAIAGTTVSGVALVDIDPDGDTDIAPYWMIFNVGDSRVYGWNGKSVVQITVDHSAVQELVYLGIITEEEALVHPDRNVITRAVGSDTQVQTDLWLMPVQGHQLFVICSDGLTKELSDDEIGTIIQDYAVESGAPRTLAQTLIDRAIERGGRDNITVVAVESTAVAAEGVEAPTESVAETD